MNTTVQFVNAWVLYLLWLVPVTAWWWHTSARKLEKRLSIFMSAEMQKKLRPASSRLRQNWQTGLVTAGLFLILMAAARPQWGTREEKVYQRGRDLVIALDVSRSMLADDVHPNRLLRAKADIMDLIKELRGDRASLLAFRKKAIILCPLTTDYAYLKQALDAISTDSAPAGETDIGDAINKAMDSLKSDEGSHKAIILISDGEDLSGKALKAAQEAGKKKIPIFTVGLGSSGGSKIPEQDKSRSYFKHKGQDVVSKLDDKTMHAIAEATKGAYIPVGTASMTSTTLGTLYRDHLSRLSAQDIEETIQRRHVERYQLFLLPAFLLLLAGSFLSRGRLAAFSVQKIIESPQMSPLKDLNPPSKPLKQLVTLIAALSVMSASLNAQNTNSQPEQDTKQSVNTATNIQPAAIVPPGREGARYAQKLYLMGKYDEAADAYLQALRGASDKSMQDFSYNAAVSLFNAKKYKEAADILKDILQKGKTGQTEIAQGLGSALYRASEMPKDADPSRLRERATLLRESGEAFKEAARSQSESKQAKKNLAVVLDTLPSAQEQARIAELMANHEKAPASQIADQMLKSQREIISGIPSAFTNDSPSQIKTLEALAEKQKENSDLWIPLKGKLLSSMAQQQGKDPKIQQQLAAFEQLVENIKGQMKNSSDALRDLDTAGYNSAVVSGNGIYQFWKSIASYQGILQEDMRRQTNSITLTTEGKQAGVDQQKMIKAEQDEALALTDIFTKRFSESVPESGEMPQPTPVVTNTTAMAGGATNAPVEQQGISKETRAKILDLAGKTSATQKSASGLLEKNNLPESLVEQRKAHDLLKEIEKLLPKDKSQNQQDQKNEKDQKQEQNQQQKQDQQKNKQDQNQQQQPEQQQKPPEQKEKQEDKKNKEDLSAEQLRKLLDKAAQRENEHEAQKRERNRSIPLSPIDRDW